MLLLSTLIHSREWVHFRVVLDNKCWLEERTFQVLESNTKEDKEVLDLTQAVVRD